MLYYSVHKNKQCCNNVYPGSLYTCPNQLKSLHAWSSLLPTRLRSQPLGCTSCCMYLSIPPFAHACSSQPFFILYVPLHPSLCPCVPLSTLLHTVCTSPSLPCPYVPLPPYTSSRYHFQHIHSSLSKFPAHSLFSQQVYSTFTLLLASFQHIPSSLSKFPAHSLFSQQVYSTFTLLSASLQHIHSSLSKFHSNRLFFKEHCMYIQLFLPTYCDHFC